jgi:hypothetical protein
VALVIQAGHEPRWVAQNRVLNRLQAFKLQVATYYVLNAAACKK